MNFRGIGTGRAGKLFLMCWGGAVVAFIAIVSIGVATGEAMGAASFAVLVSGALIDAAIVTSWWSDRVSNLLARTSWIALSLVALLSAQALLIAGHSDADIVMTYGVVVLSFPFGLMAGPLALATSVPGGPIGAALIWAIGVVLGYLQWFVLLPWFIRTIRENNGA